MINRTTLFALLSLLLLTIEAKAQYYWEVTQPYQDSNYFYCISSLSCSGDNCTAGGLIKDKSPGSSFVMVFFHSIDGGQTWAIQDPGLDHIFGTFDNQFNRVQQIDSLNIVAIGDSGLIMRTFDAGVTWHKQSYYKDRKSLLTGVHFSDSLNGILTGYGANSVVMTTSDGGRKWERVIIINSEEFIDCYSFGNGKYALLGENDGPLWITTDNFQSIEMIDLVDYLGDSTWEFKNFKGCLFLGEDTIIAYGGYRQLGNYDYGYIIRSIDRGVTWGAPYTPPLMWAVTHMTTTRGDTILAAGVPDRRIHISTDRGVSWKSDTLLHNSTLNSSSCHGIVWTKSNPLSTFTDVPASGGFPSDIFLGQKNMNFISNFSTLNYHHRIFPNPATDILNIASIEEGTPYQIYDILGRKVMNGKVLDRATLSVDVSGLPRGIYYVFVDDARDGHPVMVGKLSLVW